jgi:hypothetical protein
VLKDQKDLEEHKVHKVLLVQKDRVVTELKELRVLKVQKDRVEVQVLKVVKDHKVLKVPQVLKDHRQMPDIKQTLNLSQMLDKTLLA